MNQLEQQRHQARRLRHMKKTIDAHKELLFCLLRQSPIMERKLLHHINTRNKIAYSQEELRSALGKLLRADLLSVDKSTRPHRYYLNTQQKKRAEPLLENLRNT